VEKFDAIIIGSGQAGNPLAKRLSREGKRVAIVEMAHVGGTCINNGCTPTKTLVSAAKTIVQARKASNFGFTINNDIPDYKLIKQRKNEVVSYYREELEKWLLEDANITVFRGKGRFSGYKQVSVLSGGLNDKTITAGLICINTGARPHIPDIEGLRSVKFFTSETILELDYLPGHLLIVGGGYVAVEFAQIFRRLGSQVTIIIRSSGLLSNEDDDVRLEIARILESEGVEIVTDAAIKRIAEEDDGTTSLEIFYKDKLRTLSGTDLLIAAGRTPNTEDLDLIKTGIHVDGKGFIPVNDHLQTIVAGIYALGDIKEGPAFTHVSYHDYIVLAEILFEKKASSICNRLIPYCVFIDPELGRVGLTEKEASQMNLDFSIAKMKTSFIARAVETGETDGFLKAIVDNKTKKILGAAIISPNGGEMMSLLQVAMIGGLTYDQLRDNMFAHPTYAEAVNNLFNPVHLKSKVHYDQCSPGK
jgi:pyruvate/2-oxoglutarate dehydrogenase complex dihydrolipoamide dehydrogenase (E3) component